MRRFTILIILGAIVALGACSDQPGTTALAVPGAAARLHASAYDVIDLGTFDGATTQALGLDKH